ncbi:MULTISPECIES: hypothetical protein [unclassified Rhodococcus (in: high G+C Gram-positive bacteria)]|uniref:hypothetical protein n=1 Tax=unclassified Rhodococcus (in: high G+C Gram-positive bacteria) TaxID=192944 RepID=UPI00163B550E|nr:MULTISPECIES: hypothetical protein [unclassified Rhodococcus (in: high G+C Gram-positive bacteria)]MBC2640563.1 hypothetical protein [Rhodococcus sp. 3A]MBC2894691.1 hypothetical protein [Rhodococcus sp. 4CII]
MLDRLYAAVLAVAGLGYGGYILLDELTGHSDTPSEDEHLRADALEQVSAL